jgi:hypothetical protein
MQRGQTSSERLSRGDFPSELANTFSNLVQPSILAIGHGVKVVFVMVDYP